MREGTELQTQARYLYLHLEFYIAKGLPCGAPLQLLQSCIVFCASNIGETLEMRRASMYNFTYVGRGAAATHAPTPVCTCPNQILCEESLSYPGVRAITLNRTWLHNRLQISLYRINLKWIAILVSLSSIPHTPSCACRMLPTLLPAAGPWLRTEPPPTEAPLRALPGRLPPPPTTLLARLCGGVRLAVPGGGSRSPSCSARSAMARPGSCAANDESSASMARVVSRS